MPVPPLPTVPPAFAATQVADRGDAGRAWVAALPGLVEASLARWRLRLDGPPLTGRVALVLPVRRADGTAAALKVQAVDEETAGEPAALRAWNGDGAVRLLDHHLDAATGTDLLLLERLHPTRSRLTLPDDRAALEILCGLLARLTACPAPAGLRRLRDVATSMLEQVPRALARLPRDEDRRLVDRCAAAVADLLPEPGDRLLHWDLHYANVLAGEREPWLAIDPKPLAGDPGFELFPALWNRWEDVIADGDVTGSVRRRFDVMVATLGLDRSRAAGWTLGRILQQVLWNVEDGVTTVGPVLTVIAAAVSTYAG
ncbi:MAG TPA: aminoglycoside phosphotransferase family protein [Natronosporangium sp.]|nr:aminoglycoside phosphotransferase family protein [Natronosporangium sp.]